jgi:hypothetical protein
MSFECRPGRPWGIHPALFNDMDCPRCGWTAPGPLGDAREAAAELGWSVVDGGGGGAPAGEALAA